LKPFKQHAVNDSRQKYLLKSRATFAVFNRIDSRDTWRLRAMEAATMTGHCVINYVTTITCVASQLTRALCLTSHRHTTAHV